MITKNTLFAFAAFGALLGCQYPVTNFPTDEQRSFLQFDVEVSTGYARALVTRTSPKLEGNTIVPVPLATEESYITDSKGNRTDLPTDGSKHPAFQGQIGETYTFHATLEGKKYESLPETIQPAPLIDSLYYEFTSRQDLAENHPLKHGFDVFAQFRDFDGPGNYYQWTYTHYAKMFRCSTLVRFGTLYNVPCESDCWRIERSKAILLFSDAAVNGGDNAFPLARVPFKIPPGKYYMMVEQRAIPKNVYQYLLSAQEQTQTNGGQFDVPAQTRFSTNIFCISDPSEKVFGVLNTFDFHKKLLYILRDIAVPGIPAEVDAEYLRPTCPFLNCYAPCVESYFVTKTKPEGWED